MKAIWGILIVGVIGAGVFYFGEDAYLGVTEGWRNAKRGIVDRGFRQARAEQHKKWDERKAEAVAEKRQIAEALAALPTAAPDRALPQQVRSVPQGWVEVAQGRLHFSIPPEFESFDALSYHPQLEPFRYISERSIPLKLKLRTINLRDLQENSRHFAVTLAQWESWAGGAAKPGWAGKDDSSTSFDEDTAKQETFLVGETRVLHIKGRMVTEDERGKTYSPHECYAIQSPNDQTDEVLILSLRDGTKEDSRRIRQIVLTVRPAP